MRLIMIFAVLVCLPLSAKDNAQLLRDVTIKQEKALLEKYKIMNSQVLEKHCMFLAKDLKFERIKQCKILNSATINAYVLANGHVYFSLALLQQIKNTHQWASILAHENAHLELNHYLKRLEKLQSPGFLFPKTKIKKMNRKHEQQADQWADDRLKKYGYEAGQINFFMQRVMKLKGNKKTSTHLKNSKRIKQTENKEIIDKNLIKLIKELAS